MAAHLPHRRRGFTGSGTAHLPVLQQKDQKLGKKIRNLGKLLEDDFFRFHWVIFRLVAQLHVNFPGENERRWQMDRKICVNVGRLRRASLNLGPLWIPILPWEIEMLLVLPTTPFKKKSWKFQSPQPKNDHPYKPTQNSSRFGRCSIFLFKQVIFKWFCRPFSRGVFPSGCYPTHQD